MHRIVEPELMLSEEQALAFASANRDYGITGILELYRTHINLSHGKIIDLGSGPGQLLVALKDAYPNLTIVGYDGSYEMVKVAQNIVAGKASVIHSLFDQIIDTADCVMSSNTLHHIHNPSTFWDSIKRISSRCLVFDLVRPRTVEHAKQIVDFYAPGESEVFKTDFYNSLLAAFSVEELEEQIKGTNLKLEIIQSQHEFARCVVIHGTI